MPKSNNIELLDLIPRARLFPGEDQTSFEGLHRAFTLEFAPGTPYEVALVEDLINLGWESIRHRNIRDSLIRIKYRSVAAELCSRYAPHGVGGSEERYEAEKFAEMLLSENDVTQAAALVHLKKLGIDEPEILAKAYERAGQSVEIHEQKLAQLESRRRRLREDYENLKAARAKPVEDAELVG